MKTRREFFKTLAGSCAVVAACVVAPKSLMEKEPPIFEPDRSPALPYATSGYARVEPNIDTQSDHPWTITTAASADDMAPWNYVNVRGEWGKA